MSKIDDMRAMREARYEASRSGAARPTAAPKTQPKTQPRTQPRTQPKPKTQAQAPQRAERAEVVPEPPQAGLCGHRAISGRTCTRDAGHAAKSHRYS